MNNTVENDFYGFPKVQRLNVTGEVDNLRFSCQIFLRFHTSMPKSLKIG